MDFYNFKASFEQLNPMQLAAIRQLQLSQSNPEATTSVDFDQLAAFWVGSGLYDYFEQSRQLTVAQRSTINEMYNYKYDEKMSQFLEQDAILCDALEFYCTVIFGFVKKLLELNIVDQKVVSLLEDLKELRNFLAHKDDYVSKIVQAEPFIHVMKIARSIGQLGQYFDRLYGQLTGKITVPANTSAVVSPATIWQPVSRHYQPPPVTIQSTQQQACDALSKFTGNDWKHSDKFQFYFLTGSSQLIADAKSKLQGVLKYKTDPRRPRLTIRYQDMHLDALATHGNNGAAATVQKS